MNKRAQVKYMIDSTAQKVEKMWDALAAEGARYSKPYLQLEKSDIRSFIAGDAGPVAGSIFPGSLLHNIAGKSVLCLASGGGQQTVVFGLADAKVTVLDISQGQLDADILAAKHYGYRLEAVKGDMRDLSMFPEGMFDLVYQPISACFISSLPPLYEQAYRVLNAGGIYKVAHCNPATYAVSFAGGNCGWDGVGYRIAEAYGGGPILLDSNGRENLKEGEPTGEYVHLLPEIFGGLVEAGFQILNVYEDPRHFAGNEQDLEPGSYEHNLAFVSQYFGIVSTKR